MSMVKILDFAPVDSYGEPTIKVLPKHGSGVKLAGAQAYAPEIVEFMQTLKPVIGKIYALINAMGASEYFSCNRNGDAFYEDALKKYHHTFVTDGHPYMHHKNKDPEKSYGKVIFSAYNDKMHRVELIVEYDTEKLDSKIVDKINKGDIVNVSMGCKVDADYCSICGHKARTPAEYCKHLKYEPGLTKMLPDGRKAFAINKDPHFFDISIVTIPADPTARIMAKIAGKEDEVKSSVERAQEELNIKPEVEKTASDVMIPSIIEDIVENRRPKVNSILEEAFDSLVNRFDSMFGESIPSRLLDIMGRMGESICSPIPLLNSFIKHKIYMRPNEVQRIVLVSSGKSKLADALEDNKIVISEDPTVGLKLFSQNQDTFDDVLDCLPEELEQKRELSPINIRKITIRVVTDPEEKTASVPMEKVMISDDFKYLLGRDVDTDKLDGILSNNSLLNKGDIALAESKTNPASLMALGSIISAFTGLLGKKMSDSLLASAGALGIASVPALALAPSVIPTALALKAGLDAANEPVQEMQLLNPRSDAAVQASLLDAVTKIRQYTEMSDGLSTEESLKLLAKMASYKKSEKMKKTAAFEGINANSLSKMLLSVPIAYGASKLISHESKKNDLEKAQLTGKYEPNFLASPAVTMPVSLAVLMKYASAEKTASAYIKTAAKKGITLSNLYADLENILMK